jgi:uncharacterized membrane protein YkvA (DUF1232 family)
MKTPCACFARQRLIDPLERFSYETCMAELETRCLDAFPAWLRSLGDDARALAAFVEDQNVAEAVRRRAARAINYLFRSLDLIPDGIEDLGFIDDAFVLRVAVAGVASQAEGDVLRRLAEDAALIREFLGADFARLEKYAERLDSVRARDRSVDDVMSDAGARAALVGEVRAWADGYAAPGFARDVKNLVKLRAFLAAKLPD